MSEARQRLAALLVAAYSGEQAAALAYRGHWRSCAKPEERERIRRIEEDEWRHRRIVAGMLVRLRASPSRLRELRSRVVGRLFGALCHLAGRLLPMYAAGRLERSNVCSYDEAATLAEHGGLPELVAELRGMAEVEREHERYFRERVVTHPTLRALRTAWLGQRPSGAGRGTAEECR
jgi:demethoxyubiquinone hydroxylase (CLK1/Coq7/Cat5 family)